MNSWLVKGAAAIGVAAVFVGLGFTAGANATLATQAKNTALIQKAADEVEQRTAKRIADIRVVNRTIQGELREVIRENVVYRDCVLDDATRGLLDAARSGSTERAD